MKHSRSKFSEMRFIPYHDVLIQALLSAVTELVESAMYLYQATGDPEMLHIGASVIEALESIARTECGYAVVHDVETHQLANRMESFFLAETTKYLYLLFDETNFIHNSGGEGTVVNTPNGQCVLDAGGYIFNTEAHPIDMAALDCCFNPPREQYHRVIDDINLLGLVDTDSVQDSRFLSPKYDEDKDYNAIDIDGIDTDTIDTDTIDVDIAEEEEAVITSKLQERRKRNMLLTCRVESFNSKFAIYGETIPQ